MLPRGNESRASWGLFAVIVLLTGVFIWMQELVWTFLAVWSIVVLTATALAHRSWERIVPKGIVLFAAVPMLLFAFILILGVRPAPYGAWENLLTCLGFYSVSFLTFHGLYIGTGTRLNWVLLSWSVVFLSFTICAMAVILEFLSDLYLGTNYLNDDNKVAMIQITWNFFGSIALGWVVKRHARTSLSFDRAEYTKVVD